MFAEWEFDTEDHSLIPSPEKLAVLNFFGDCSREYKFHYKKSF